MKHMYFKSPKGEPLVAHIHKCGTHTITEALHFYEHVAVEDSDAYPIRLGFIRDPIERFCSWYSCAWGNLLEGHRDSNNGAFDSYHVYVDHALDQGGVPYLEPYTQAFPNMNKVYPLSRLNEVWFDWFTGPRMPGWQHRFLPAPDIDDYRLEEIREAYKGDLELWHSL